MFGAFSSFLEDTAKQLSTASEGIYQNISTTLDTTLGTAPADPKHHTASGHSSDAEGSSDEASSAHYIHSINGPLLFTAPPSLEKFSSEWRILIDGLLEDENTFSVPLDVLADDADTLQNLEKAQFSTNAAELHSLMREALTAGSAPHEALVNAVVGSEEAQKTRFELVPGYLSESHYWGSLIARVALLRRCASLEQLFDVMDILNHEPRRQKHADDKNKQSRRKGFGRLDNAVLLQNIRDRVLAARSVNEWVDQRLQAARSEVHSTMSSLQLLRNLVIKQEISELADSVCESCRYRKGKVATILAEMRNTSGKLVGTPLEPDNGELYMELMTLNEELHQSIVAYNEMKQKSEKSDNTLSSSPDNYNNNNQGSSTSLALAAAAVDATTGGSSMNGSRVMGTPPTSSTKTDESSGFVKVSAPEDTDAEFTADLPWDDDDDQ